MPDSACPAAGHGSSDILIWDADGFPDAWPGISVLWSRFEDASSADRRLVSMPRIVEEMAEDLRSRYLEWVHDLGQAVVDGRTISEHLLIRPGFSYWGLAAPWQKCSILSTSLIPDAIKLLALEGFIFRLQPKVVVLSSSNSRLAECLAEYCSLSGRRFEWRTPMFSGHSNAPARERYLLLPRGIRALLSFCWFYASRLLTIFQKNPIRRTTGNISFFDVLTHLDQRGLKSGQFLSNYWGLLVEKLSVEGFVPNWFHFFHPHPVTPSYAAAHRLVTRFNIMGCGRRFHRLVDTIPSVITAFQAWRDYLRLRRVTGLVKNVAFKVRPKASEFNLWPLHEDAWAESVAGPNALMECMRLASFEVLLARLPRQQVGIFVSENQPWEISLIYAWKKSGHGLIVAAPHTTVRYWDLRYFHDPRVYFSKDSACVPLPDLYAVNGPAARAALLGGGCPEERIVEVEALRFTHLSALPVCRVSGGKLSDILVCGDFSAATNDQIFEWLHLARQSFPNDVRIFFKPHPAFPYNPPSVISSSINLLVDDRPLMELLQVSEIVITSALTSAAIDAYCAGKRVIQIAGGGGLNANPLRGFRGVTFATTPEVFAEALATALQDVSTLNRCGNEQYFRIDPNLPEWLRLLRGEPNISVLPSSHQA